MSRVNQSHHLHCYHSDSSHYHLSPPTAIASSQVSVLLHWPPAICHQDSRLHSHWSQIMYLSGSKLCNGPLFTQITRVLTAAHLLSTICPLWPLSPHLLFLVLAHFTRTTMVSMLFLRHAWLAQPCSLYLECTCPRYCCG